MMGPGGAEADHWWLRRSISRIIGCVTTNSDFQGFMDMEHQSINYLLDTGPEEDEGHANGMKTQMVLLAGEGRNEGESGRGQPGSGASAAEGDPAEEFSGEGGPAAAAGVLMDNSNIEDLGAAGCDQEKEKQPEEPGPSYMGDLENVKPVSLPLSTVNPLRVLVPEFRCFWQHSFTLLQLQELESIFQSCHYISTTEAKRLARSMGVSEVTQKLICRTDILEPTLSVGTFGSPSSILLPLITCPNYG